MRSEPSLISLSNMFVCIFILMAWPAVASPTAVLEDRAEPCRGSTTQIYSEACWQTLGLTTWLDQWYKETPNCGDTDDAMSCCYPKSRPQEAWSTCFLRIMTQQTGYDCSDINARSCQIEVVQPKNDSAEVRYVLRNMFQMYNLFATWNDAVGQATTQAALVVPGIISTIDPEKQTNLVLTYVLTALTAGLAFLGAPAVGAAAEATIGKTVASIGGAASVALQQAPGVAKAVWPSGTVNSQIVQIGNLQSQLADLGRQSSNLVNDGLHEAMYNHESFIQMASKGTFSGQTIPSISKQEQGLDMAFRTYVTSVAMSQNSWRASYEALPASGVGTWPSPRYQAAGLPPANVAPDGYAEAVSQADLKDGGYANDNGELPQVAKDWAGWVSSSTRRGWTADQCCHKNNPTAKNLLSQIRANKWADLGLLFDGSYRCTVAAQSSPTADRPPVRIDGNNLDFGCISQLPQMMGCDGCPVEPTNGGTCQFVQWDGCPDPGLAQ